jgi:hypothetical protein
MTGATGPENRQLRAVFFMLAAVIICAALAIWGLMSLVGIV